MTAAHAGAGAAFYAVDGTRAYRTADRVDDFAFRNRFAAADDAAVCGVLGDEGFLVVIAEGAEAGLGRTALLVVFLLRRACLRPCAGRLLLRC